MSLALYQVCEQLVVFLLKRRYELVLTFVVQHFEKQKLLSYLFIVFYFIQNRINLNFNFVYLLWL